MRLGVFARTFPGHDPLAVLVAAKAAGFDWAQWNMACSGLGALPTTIPDAIADAVAAASRETGVGLIAVSATYNMVHPDPAAREAGRAAFEAIAGAARRMEISALTVCTGSRDVQDQWRHHPENASAEIWEDFLAEMRLLLDIAARHRLVIGVEPEAANVVSSAPRAQAMLAALGGPRHLGIVLDPANLWGEGESFPGDAAIARAVELLGGRIMMAHAKDRDASGRVVPAGQGVVDFAAFLDALSRVGFGDGAVVAHGMGVEEAPGVARHLRGLMR